MSAGGDNIINTALYTSAKGRNMRRRAPEITGLAVLAAAALAGMACRQYRRDLAQAYRRITSGGRIAATACGPVQYAESGEGPPLLIVHGAGGGYDQGLYFARFIGGDYRWIAPSRFGFLGTPAPQGADSARQADAYACLLDSLNVERVGVIGVSMGGPSTLLFAQRYPQRTTSLALVSAASHALPPRPAVLAALFSLFLNDFVFWSLVRLSPQGLLAALGVPAEVQKQLSREESARLQAFIESILPMSARRSGQLLEQQMSEYPAELIGIIQAPALVLHACDDTLVDCEQGKFSARNIPGADFILMEKGGHLALMLDFNAGSRARLREFLERHNRLEELPSSL